MGSSGMKKPSRVVCKKLVSRLSGLEFRPNTPEGVEVLIDALEKTAESEEHATKIIDSFVNDPTRKCPTGYDIRQRGYDYRTVEKRPDSNCEKCFGSGFKSVVRDGYPYS